MCSLRAAVISLTLLLLSAGCAAPAPVSSFDGGWTPQTPRCPWPDSDLVLTADVNEAVNASFPLLEQGGFETSVTLSNFADSDPEVFKHDLANVLLPAYRQVLYRGVARSTRPGTFTRTFRFTSDRPCDGSDEFTVRLVVTGGRVVVTPAHLELGDFPSFGFSGVMGKTRPVVIRNARVTPPEAARSISFPVDSNGLLQVDSTGGGLRAFWVDGGTVSANTFRLAPGEDALLYVVAAHHSNGFIGVPSTMTLTFWDATLTSTGAPVTVPTCVFTRPSMLAPPSDGGVLEAELVNSGSETCFFDGFRIHLGGAYFELLEPGLETYVVDAGSRLPVRIARTSAPLFHDGGTFGYLHFGSSSDSALSVNIPIGVAP